MSAVVGLIGCSHPSTSLANSLDLLRESLPTQLQTPEFRWTLNSMRMQSATRACFGIRVFEETGSQLSPSTRSRPCPEIVRTHIGRLQDIPDEIATVQVAGSFSKLYINPSRKKIRVIGNLKLTAKGYFFALDGIPSGRTVGFQVDKYRCYIDPNFGTDAGCQ